MLIDGELDTAPISSIEYARNADKLKLLPRLCVALEGAVESIQLVTRKPLDQVRVVAVTPESATSVVLTKVLSGRERYSWARTPTRGVLIGDAALKSAYEDPTPHHDLGRLWLERTGLPMVFAVWACPEPVADGLAELEDALVASSSRAPSRSSSRSRRPSATATRRDENHSGRTTLRPPGRSGFDLLRPLANRDLLRRQRRRVARAPLHPRRERLLRPHVLRGDAEPSVHRVATHHHHLGRRCSDQRR